MTFVSRCSLHVERNMQHLHMHSLTQPLLDYTSTAMAMDVRHDAPCMLRTHIHACCHALWNAIVSMRAHSHTLPHAAFQAGMFYQRLH